MIMMAPLKFTKIVNEEKQCEKTHLKPYFKKQLQEHGVQHGKEGEE
jgi:hypothetical protein